MLLLSWPSTIAKSPCRGAGSLLTQCGAVWDNSLQAGAVASTLFWRNQQQTKQNCSVDLLRGHWQWKRASLCDLWQSWLGCLLVQPAPSSTWAVSWWVPVLSEIGIPGGLAVASGCSGYNFLSFGIVAQRTVFTEECEWTGRQWTLRGAATAGGRAEESVALAGAHWDRYLALRRPLPVAQQETLLGEPSWAAEEPKLWRVPCQRWSLVGSVQGRGTAELLPGEPALSSPGLGQLCFSLMDSSKHFSCPSSHLSPLQGGQTQPPALLLQVPLLTGPTAPFPPEVKGAVVGVGIL